MNKNEYWLIFVIMASGFCARFGYVSPAVIFGLTAICVAIGVSTRMVLDGIKLHTNRIIDTVDKTKNKP